MSTRGRKRVYASEREREQAKVARRREKRQQQAAQRNGQVGYNIPELLVGPSIGLPPPNYENFYYDDQNITIQIEDEFDQLLHPPSPSLGSASMVTSEIESCELNVYEPIQDFQDIDDLVPDVGQSDDLVPGVGQSEVDKLAIQLTNQLVQFQGCCSDCHEHFNREHADEHELDYGLQTFLSESKDEALSGCPDVLGSNQIAPHDDDLAGSMSAVQKRWMFSGIYPDNPDEAPMHICLQKGDTPCQTATVTFDIDSITGYATSLGVAKGGIRWNPMQMPVSDLQSSLHLHKRQVHYFDSHGHAHSVLKPVHEIPHYTIGRLVGFEDVSLYLLFPRLFREGQQNSRLLDDDFETWMDRVLLPAIYKHHVSSQTQHYPSSHQHGKCNSTARGVE